LGGRKLLKYYTEVTPMIGILLISAYILDFFRTLQSLKKWNKGINIIPGDERFYTTQYMEDFVKHAKNEYCAKLRCLQVIKPEDIPNANVVTSVIASRSGQSCYDPCDLSSDDDKY
jgi:hypothetical protein